MKDERKTKKQLIAELTKLRTQVAGLEGSKSDQPSKAVSAEMDDRFRLFYEQSPLGYQSLDEDGRILEVNPTWLGMLGYNHDEVIGKWFGDFLAVSYRDHFRDSFPKFKEAGEIRGVQFDMLRKDGQTFTAEHDGKIGYDECGNFKQTHCVMRDITQRKQTEEVLRQTVAEREKLEAIVNRSRAMVSLWRLQEGWPVEYVSDNVKQVLGYSANDLLSGRISWPGITHPDDLLELEAEVEKYLEEGVDEFTQEYRVTSKAGEIRWIRDRNKVLRDSDGTATHMQSILTDITEYKLAEKELRDMHGIVNKSSIVAYMCKADEDWTTEFISDNVRDVLGYSPEDFYSGRVGFSEIVYPDDFQRAKAEYERLVQDNEPDEIIIEYRLKSGSGEEIWIEDRSWAIRDANGKVAYVQGVDVDITERKRAEEEIESKSRTNQIILDAFPCVALLLRPQTREIVASNKMAVEVGAIPGKTCFETWFQRETPCPWCLAEKVWSDGKAQHCEPTSMGVTWDVYWIPVSDDVYMHFAFDITDRKKTENALEESEEKYRRLFETETDAIMVFDAETRQFVDVNNAAVHLYGYSREEFLKIRHDDMTAELEDSDVSIKLTLAGAVTRVPVRYHKKKDGTIFPVEISASSFTMKGRKVLCGVIRDITERKKAEQKLKESEEKYRHLYENSPF
ncbi:MAG: PAS domain S-box protein, partial [candidate division Zixibacteria bacterium]|nr:PAS domain S-box protein [candidate division Zixibacteria bacterium]